MRRLATWSVGVVALGGALLWSFTPEPARPAGAPSDHGPSAPGAVSAAPASSQDGRAPPAGFPAAAASVAVPSGADARTLGAPSPDVPSTLRPLPPPARSDQSRAAEDQRAERRAEHDRARAERHRVLLEEAAKRRADAERRREIFLSRAQAAQANRAPDPDRPPVEGSWQAAGVTPPERLRPKPP